MAKANKKEEKKIKVKIVYDNFVNKYTKKRYTLNEVIEVTDKRLGEILELEKTSGKKLIEIIDDTPKADDTNKDIVNNENGDENTNGADNNNDGDGKEDDAE
jgi:hypothetical protein